MSPIVEKILSLLWLHIWFGLFAYGIYGTLYRDFAGRLYDRRRKSPLGGFSTMGLKKRDYIKSQQILVCFTIPLVVLTYIASLISVFNGEAFFDGKNKLANPTPSASRAKTRSD